MGDKRINYRHNEFQVLLRNSNRDSRNFAIWAETKFFKSGLAYIYI